MSRREKRRDNVSTAPECSHSAQKNAHTNAENMAFDEFKINLHLRTSRFFSIAQIYAFCQAPAPYFSQKKPGNKPVKKPEEAESLLTSVQIYKTYVAMRQ